MKNAAIPSKEQLELTVDPYSDEDLEVNEDTQSKIDKLMKFFDTYGISYDKFDPESIPGLDFAERKAYPNTDVYMNIPGQRDTQKWLHAIREIYQKEKTGENRVQAIRRVTSGWDIMETHDFLNWVKFYETGDHMKYKFAQLWYENPEMGPGYFLQVKKDPEPTQEPRVSGRDVDMAKEDASVSAERKQVIEKQRNKIIGRLDSAEKLLRTHDGQIFSGKEFESLLESIYQLKKKIQMVNKISSSTKLYEDMIVRQANILNRSGFVRAANVLFSVAQSPGQSGEQAKGDVTAPPDPPIPASPGDPSGAGNPGPPSGAAGTPAQPDGNVTMPQSEPNNPPKGISDFMAGLEKANFSPTDKNIAEDDLEVIDGEDELLVTEAQVAPPKAVDEPLTTSPAPAALDPSPVRAPGKPDPSPDKSADEPLEVSEDISPEDGAPAESGNFNAKMDAMMANVTIANIVSELEDLAKVFKVREIPRRLSLVDMMLDSKGISSYFPQLSEAQNKALESNNYISTRVEDILSKLRGAMSTKDIDLKGGDIPDSPEVAGIKEKLKSDEDKEKNRKQMRKDQEAEELSGKETPEVEIEEDLAPPAAAPPKVAPPAAPPIA
jgi:hypothetical protein